MLPTPARIALPLAVLGFYYWSLAVSPVVEPAPPEPPRATASSVDAIRQLTDEADAAYRAGRYDAALKPLLELNHRSANQAIVVGRLAKVYGHLGRRQEEAAYWEQFITSSPTPTDACPQLPHAYEAQGLEDQAFDAYRRCYDLDQADSDLIFFYGRALERRGQAARARELYEAGLKITPDYTDMSLGLTRLYLRASNLAAAARVAGAAVKSQPDNVDALLVAGQTALRQDRRADARRYLAHALSLKDTYADLHLVMAMVERADGNRAEAVRHCDRALQLEPDNRDAQALCRALGAAR